MLAAPLRSSLATIVVVDWQTFTGKVTQERDLPSTIRFVENVDRDASSNGRLDVQTMVLRGDFGYQTLGSAVESNSELGASLEGHTHEASPLCAECSR